MKLNREYSIKEIADLYHCSLSSNIDYKFNSISSINKIENHSLVYISDKRHLAKLDSNIDCAILIAKDISLNTKNARIICDNPLFVFSRFLSDYIDNNKIEFFTPPSGKLKYPSSTTIYPNVSIGSSVEIGDNCIIYPNVSIYDNCKIGNNVIIQSGCVIGSDGFGLVKNESNFWFKVPQIGDVVIEDNVEIGANSTIDRGAIDSTIIRRNVKIDNQVQIAHNVEIDENTAIAACVGIAGSTTIGKNCTIGGGSGINGHIQICDDVHINGMTMVTKSISEAGSYASGTTVQKASIWRKNQARFKNLDQIVKKINIEEKNNE